MAARDVTTQAWDLSRDDEDLELMSDEELLALEGQRQHKGPSVRLVPVLLGTTALLGCAFLVVCNAVWSHGQVATVHPASPTSARALLESSELAEVVADNVMKQSGTGLSPSDRAHVRGLALQKFQNVSSQFRVFDPAGSQVLDEISIDGEQRKATLRLLQSLSDPRMQRMSLLVAHAVRDSPSQDPAMMERHLSETLAPHEAEIRELMDVIRPQPLSDMLGEDMHLKLDSDHIRILKSFGDGWDMQITATAAIAPPAAVPESRRLQTIVLATTTVAASSDTAVASATASPLYSANKAFSILKMIFDQCRVVLDIIKSSARLFNHDLNVNPWLTSAFGMADAIFAATSCELDGAARNMNTMKMASCPLEVASAASDAIRWLLAKYHMIKYPGNTTEAGAPAAGSRAPGLSLTSIAGIIGNATGR